MSNRKRYKIELTGAQINVICTACSEWGAQELELDTPEGRAIDRKLKLVAASLYRQQIKIEERRRVKL